MAVKRCNPGAHGMLLKTRFYIPPLRENGVVRTRLLERLKTSGGGELILVSAPAGYGKTTLVSQWLHYQPHTFAWLTLGQEHNAPAVFWEYTLTALRQIQPEIGEEAVHLIRATQEPHYRSVIVSLLNDLDRLSVRNASRDPITLVFDDFHLLKNPELLQLCNLFLDHLPSCLRLVITAREEPALALAKRRASGQLHPIGIEELRFNAAETRDFLYQTMALPAAAEVTTRLCDKTEGWVAGLQLAAISMRQRPAEVQTLLEGDGIDRHIADYLLEEVFSGLPVALQDFLLQTSLVKRFCAGLVNAMTQQAGAQEKLALLENAHLFLVPLDNHRSWFRYHDLFRQFLLQRVKAQDRMDILARVSPAIAWLENNGYYDDAIELCLDTSMFSDAVRLLTQTLALDITPEAQAKLSHWTRRIPSAMLPVAATVSAPEGDVGVESLPPELSGNVQPLTRREMLVLDLIAKGLSNKEIAEALHVSTNTLKVHIRNLYGKIGVENRTQALLRVKAPS